MHLFRYIIPWENSTSSSWFNVQLRSPTLSCSPMSGLCHVSILIIMLSFMYSFCKERDTHNRINLHWTHMHMHACAQTFTQTHVRAHVKVITLHRHWHYTSPSAMTTTHSRLREGSLHSCLRKNINARVCACVSVCVCAAVDSHRTWYTPHTHTRDNVKSSSSSAYLLSSDRQGYSLIFHRVREPTVSVGTVLGSFQSNSDSGPLP